ncbi:MAG: phosphoribosylanthranilate isomerase [Phycisphaeraceae bacterium]|nr:MAG: phosphoribosylanthranilate isomerase [Phycisphaeraceae bacterium]
MGRTRVKICGVKDTDAAVAAAEAGADAVGFVFVRSSARYVEPDEAAEIMMSLPPMVSTVGVFMNASAEAYADIEEACPTTHAQLHGSEDEGLVSQCGPAVKAVRFMPESIAGELARWGACEDVEAILIDSPTPGEGVPFRWEDLVPHVAGLEKPWILAGGLTPGNVGEAVRVLRPYAVDVSSGVERARGEKDTGLIEAFCEAVRRADLG